MGNLTNSYAATVASEFDASKIATVNAMAQILDSAIAGELPLSTTGGTTTLTGTPAAPQAQNMFLNVSGTLTSNATIEIPVAAGTGRNRIYIVKNGTTGAFTLTVKKVGGTGVMVGQGQTAFLYYDASDIAHVFTTWASYTPTWTNLTVGNGTVVAKYCQIGRTVFVRISLVWGSTTSISGSVSVSTPTTQVSYGGTAGISALGNARLSDNSAGITHEGVVLNISTTTVLLTVHDASGTYLKAVVLSSTVPFTWTNPDEITATFSYETA